MRLSELTRARRRRLSRYAHKLARSGRFESAEAVVSEIRGHEDFDHASHEAPSFLAALSVAHPRVGCRRALIRLPLSRVPDGPAS
jgi:hypothetical protein